MTLGETKRRTSEMSSISTYLDRFYGAYMRMAMELSEEDGEKQCPGIYAVDFSDAMKGMEDCQKFISENEAYLAAGSAEQGGRDFWLTRNHHGSGFWDIGRPWGKEAGGRLTEAAHTFKEIRLVKDLDGKFYFE